MVADAKGDVGTLHQRIGNFGRGGVIRVHCGEGALFVDHEATQHVLQQLQHLERPPAGHRVVHAVVKHARTVVVCQ